MDLYFKFKNTYIFYHFLNFEGNLKFYNSQLTVFPCILIAKNPWKGRLRFFLTLEEHSEFSGDGETADGLGFSRHIKNFVRILCNCVTDTRRVLFLIAILRAGVNVHLFILYRSLN